MSSGGSNASNGLDGAQGKAGDPDLGTAAGETTGSDVDETGVMPETPAGIARVLAHDAESDDEDGEPPV